VLDRRFEALNISYANFGGQLRDFREIPGDDLARLVGYR
jgi:hypothetical protein